MLTMSKLPVNILNLNMPTLHSSAVGSCRIFLSVPCSFSNCEVTVFCPLVGLSQRSVSEWMQKALEVELTDWHRDQEPDTDHEGYYHTSLPTIITQVLPYPILQSFC